MTNLPSTDLTKLHTSIRDSIAQQFPDLKTVEFYRDDESSPITPACLLELDAIDHNENQIGTGQTTVALRFNARLIFSCQNSPEAPLQIRLAAAALCAFLDKNRFCGSVSPAIVHSATEDMFKPGLDGRFVIWRIEWVHREALLGTSTWENEGGSVLTQVYSNDEMLEDANA